MWKSVISELQKRAKLSGQKKPVKEGVKA